MTIYQACQILNIWPMVKARAEVWSVSEVKNKKSISNLKLIAKNNFKQLAMVHHPDKGGNKDEYLNIQEAYEIIKKAEMKNFINALDDEKKQNIKYFNPGCLDCKNCSKWSDMIGLCMTVHCSGFESSNVCSKNDMRGKRTNFQSQGFLKKGSKRMGKQAGCLL